LLVEPGESGAIRNQRGEPGNAPIGLRQSGFNLASPKPCRRSSLYFGENNEKPGKNALPQGRARAHARRASAAPEKDGRVGKAPSYRLSELVNILIPVTREFLRSPPKREGAPSIHYVNHKTLNITKTSNLTYF
jgi:hypothetical protein